MLERIKEYFENRIIRKILKNATIDIFSKDIDFDFLKKKYVKNKKGVDKLLRYCILTIAADRTPNYFEDRYDKVIKLYYETLKEGILSNSINNITDTQKRIAEMALHINQLERLNAEYESLDNGYSFSSMQYKLEKSGKGPITPKQLNFITKTSKKIELTEYKIKQLERKNN
ncbi:MAG: hypothetical protein GZ086_01330 [Gelidibacter sp.]|nr:hypothetical protein [Gelidibacter sp.]